MGNINYEYDMCVDEATLLDILSTLKSVNIILDDAVKQMLIGLKESSNFLEGAQFDKAVHITQKNAKDTLGVVIKIQQLCDYVESLEEYVRAYASCEYNSP